MNATLGACPAAPPRLTARYSRTSCSATHTGFSPPSISNVCVTFIWMPPGTSSTLVSVARMRTLESTGSGAGKRTRS